MKTFISVPFIFAVVLMVSCQPKIVSRAALIKYIDKNGQLNQTAEANGITVNLKYYPFQFLISQELGDDKSLKKVQEIEKKYAPNYYFKLAFSKNSKEVIRQLGSFKEYSDMLQVFSFEMGKHINITTNTNDTLYLKGYSFDQNFGMSAGNTMILIFDKAQLKDHDELKINIGEFGLRTGNVNFIISTKEIAKVPDLDYNR